MIQAHNYFPKKILDVIPDIYGQEKVDDPIVYLKLFTPDGSATWLITEYDRKDLMFGFACLGDPDMAELGYISLDEIKGVRGRLGMRVERDLHWQPMPLSAAKQREFNLV
jgi:hypothetical protein